MAQSSMTANPAIGQAGTFANNVDTTTIQRVANGTIPPGTYVVITADDDSTCENPDTSAEVAGDATTARGLGIAMLDHKRTTANYSAGDTVTIMTYGEIWVATETSSTAGLRPFVRFTAGGEQIGGFRHDADTNEAVALPGAVWLSTQGSAAGLAIVKLGGVLSASGAVA
jgi:hypothetical protein